MTRRWDAASAADRLNTDASHRATSPLDFQTDASRFFAEVKNPLVGALVIRTGSRALAEDIAQEAIARAWADWPAVSVMTNPRGWVFRVAFNLSTSHWRKLRSRRRAEHRSSADTSLTTPSPEILAVEHLALREAIAGLTGRQQEVVILRHFVRMTVAETAETLGVTPGTVKTLNHRALAALRVSLDADVETDTGEHHEG